jgi:predicted exporter
MLAIVVGNENMQNGPIPIALEIVGFEPREVSTIDEAARVLGALGAKDCIVIVHADALGSRAASSRWAKFLADHPALAAVVVARGEADPGARAVAIAPHRILLEDPFDAAAVAAAALRASATAMHRVRPASNHARQAG